MKLDELRQGQLVMTGRTMLKVSTVYPGRYVTAEQVLPVPPRTTVRAYLPPQVDMWREPSPGALARYEAAWDLG